VPEKPTRLLIAASGTGGHLFPALALAERIQDYKIEWLGVPDRLEQTLVGDRYPLHTISIEGFQQRFGLKTLSILLRQIGSIFQVRRLLKERKIDIVFSTGGYIAGPAIIAARSCGIPVVLHESNFIPGKVTSWFGRWCEVIALGFAGTAKYLRHCRTVYVSTPVRSQFLFPQPLDLPIPPDVPLIVVVGGSQGAVAVNKLVRQAAPAWLETGAFVVHLTGNNDPDALSFQHPNYISMPFYENMAALFQRSNLSISRAGAGTLTELAVTHTPAILIPYPYAAEDHQAYNAKVFEDADAAIVYRQSELTARILESQVLDLLRGKDRLDRMAANTEQLAFADSAERLGNILQQVSSQEFSRGGFRK
jgi:UDP-N-acetylglucosamine--N-acetylmuramyl-(pentapeptide) pyrophosphoryl-undecaprenol N-acetylglucosamine transferase